MNKFQIAKQEIMSPGIKSMVEQRLGEKSGSFITSVLDLIGSDASLMNCDPKLVMKECMKAAALDLPISKNLGFAYVIPYKAKGVPIPQFQMGHKGYIQLALRTGQYKHLNAGVIYEGEEVQEDRLKGTLQIAGKKTSEKAIGYFSYMQLINGFEKAEYCTKAEIDAHKKKFSKGYTRKDSAWQTDFDSMAKKTMILKLVPKYGPMGVAMSEALQSESKPNIEGELEVELEEKANSKVIDITPEEQPEIISNLSEDEKAEIEQEEMKTASGPNF